MTALKKYQKLESTGLWRDAPEAQRREVVVAFGDASLVLGDPKTGSALSHWSLAAVQRLNPGALPALFAPENGALAETLELDDPTMIEAIETVRSAISRARARPGRLRGVLVAGALLVAAGLGVFWLPGALIARTAAMVPPPAQVEIGQMVLADLTRLSGQPCATPLGKRASARFAARVLGAGQGPVLVLREGLAGSAELPGGFILLSRYLVEDQNGPEVAAGYTLAAQAQSEVDDPLVAVLRHAGLIATFRLLISGSLPAGSVTGFAEGMLTRPPQPLPEARLLAAFTAASLASSPYAYAVDPSGETVLGLIEADPFRGRKAPPLLSDDDWISLQAICDAP